MSDSLSDVLERARSDDANLRTEAAEALGQFAFDSGAVEQLGVLLYDEFVDIQIVAAETLMRRCGAAGLEQVLNELVRRSGDGGDLDYIVMKIHEVAATQWDELFQEAMLIAVRSGSDATRSLVDELIADFNRMQNLPYNEVNPDGSLKPERPWRR